jgi:hypothetical protein
VGRLGSARNGAHVCEYFGIKPNPRTSSRHSRGGTPARRRWIDFVALRCWTTAVMVWDPRALHQRPAKRTVILFRRDRR